MPARTFRIPLVGPYTSRVSAVNASDSTSGYVGVGIVGLMIVGKSTQATDKDARYVNCFAQTVSDPLTGAKKIYCVKRPGWTTQSTPEANSKGYAILVWTGSGAGTAVISGFGSANSNIYSGSSLLGAITGRVTGITETLVGSTPTLVMSSTDNTAWVYDSAMAQITDVDYPGNAGLTTVGTFAHLDGYACIMTNLARLYASDLNSVTSWTSTSFDTANAYPDLGVGVVRFKNYLMAFGQQSIQFFYNAGLSPFPFAKIVAMTIKVGAVSADAITQIADTIFWCGTTPEGGMSIFQWDGNLSRISQPEIEAVMILAGASNISMTSVRFFGRSFILVLAGPTTLCYCIEEKFWFEWNSTTPLWYKCASVMRGSTMANYAVSNVSTTGKVFLMNNASLSFQDNGVAYTARVQLPNMDLGTQDMKFWHALGLVGDQVSSSIATISCSDDDYQTFTTLGTLDLSGVRPVLRRLGASRRRGWVITHASNTPMREEALELTVSTRRAAQPAGS